MAWEKMRKGASYSSANAPFISLRRNQVAFSVNFIRHANLLKATHVVVMTDRETRQVGFRFLNEASDSDALTLVRDGSKPSADSRIVQTNMLFKHAWVKAILTNRSSHRFVPRKELDLWVIDLGPAFEVEVAEASEVPAEVTGVYRYLDGDEVTYIGRGRIRQRMQDSHRDSWAFDRVQYSPLNNAEEEQRWEQVLLDEYEEKNGKLPRENRVRGYIANAD